MKIYKFTFLGFYLNGAATSGKYDDVTIDVVKQHIEEGTIFQFLAERLDPYDLDYSGITDEDRRELIEEWQSLSNATTLSELKVRGDSGLGLLVAYLLEGIQSRIGTDLDIKP